MRKSQNSRKFRLQAKRRQKRRRQSRFDLNVKCLVANGYPEREARPLVRHMNRVVSAQFPGEMISVIGVGSVSEMAELDLPLFDGGYQLTEQGRQQALALGAALSDITIPSSTFQRVVEHFDGPKMEVPIISPHVSYVPDMDEEAYVDEFLARRRGDPEQFDGPSTLKPFQSQTGPDEPKVGAIPLAPHDQEVMRSASEWQLTPLNPAERTGTPADRVAVTAQTLKTKVPIIPNVGKIDSYVEMPGSPVFSGPDVDNAEAFFSDKSIEPKVLFEPLPEEIPLQTRKPNTGSDVADLFEAPPENVSTIKLHENKAAYVHPKEVFPKLPYSVIEPPVVISFANFGNAGTSGVDWSASVEDSERLIDTLAALHLPKSAESSPSSLHGLEAPANAADMVECLAKLELSYQFSDHTYHDKRHLHLHRFEMTDGEVEDPVARIDREEKVRQWVNSLPEKVSSPDATPATDC